MEFFMMLLVALFLILLFFRWVIIGVVVIIVWASSGFLAGLGAGLLTFIIFKLSSLIFISSVLATAVNQEKNRNR